MTTLNSEVRIQDKSGTVISTVSLNTFFSPLNNASFSAFDPHVRFDPIGNRWVVVAAADAVAGTSATLFAASQTTDPTGIWNFISIRADGSGANWADYPALGMNKDWIVVTVNLFTVVAPNTFVNAQVYVINKAQLYAGGAVTTKTFTDSSGGFSLQPAVTHDAALATLYLLGSWNGNPTPPDGNGYVRLSTISGAVGAEVFTTGTFFPFYASPWDWGSVGEIMPQLGDAHKIDGGDDRIMNCVYRSSSLWCSQTVYLPAASPTRSAAQWWQINPVTGAVQQFGRVDDPTGINFYAFPTMAVNKNNDVLLGYSSFSATQYPSASYSFRYGTDTANTLQASTIFKAGEAKYYKTYSGTSNRWGDYSSTVVDPADDLTLWSIQEYSTTPSGVDRWATWWAKVDPTGLSPVNGACGGSNNQAFSVAPSTNFCSAGVSSAVSGSGPWRWTCSGSNGGTIANCLAYSTSQQVTSVTQNFDSVIHPALPPGWSSNVASGSGGIWQTNIGTVHPSGTAAHSPNNLVYFNSWTVSTGVAAYLASPAFSLTGKSGSKVSFWMYHDTQYSNADRIDVYVNTAANLTGASLLGSVNRYNGTSGWFQYTFDIPATFTGATNYLLINGVSDFGNDIHLDDITVYAFTPAYYQLGFNFAGTGYGSVNSAPSGVSCTGTTGSGCAPYYFLGGSSVSLSASADLSSANNSTFTGWATNTTACPGTGPCSVTMNGPVNVTGTFNRDKLVKITPTGVTYGSILEAYTAAATSGQTIQVRDNSVLTPFSDALLIIKSITMVGGFDSGFATNNGYTTTNGVLRIGNGGVLKVQRIIIK